METLKKGSRGSDVKKLQELLGITADGIFGAGTAARVVEFQATHGLEADGIVGTKTWEALMETCADAQGTVAEPDITKMPLQNNIKRKDRRIKYIVIHYTAGRSSKPGNAAAGARGANKKGKDASADFFVDDKEIVQANPDLKKYISWHVGDGDGKYGITNTNSVGIEMCSTLADGTNVKEANHTGWSVSKAVLERTAELTRYLMKKYDVPKERVVRHYDASRKCCPGIPGWNDGNLHDAVSGKNIGKNNSEEWKKWWKAL